SASSMPILNARSERCAFIDFDFTRIGFGIAEFCQQPTEFILNAQRDPIFLDSTNKPCAGFETIGAKQFRCSDYVQTLFHEINGPLLAAACWGQYHNRLL